MTNDASFLGRGWGFPPSFSNGGADVEMTSGAEDIYQSLKIIMATQPGERVMQDKFGCDMNGFVFEELDQSLINEMRQIISDAILYHEPRIDLNKLTISEDPEQQGLLVISMEYTIRGTNSRYNMVYPFYLNEANEPIA